MEWYHWLLIAIGVIWVACAVINYVLLRKMGWEVVLRGEGGHFWLFFAPYWVYPFYRCYREWLEDEPDIVKQLKETLKDVEKWGSRKQREELRKLIKDLR